MESGDALVATKEGVVLPDRSKVTGPAEAVRLIMLWIVDITNRG
jgi:hypothetical protein